MHHYFSIYSAQHTKSLPAVILLFSHMRRFLVYLGSSRMYLLTYFLLCFSSNFLHFISLFFQAVRCCLSYRQSQQMRQLVSAFNDVHVFHANASLFCCFRDAMLIRLFQRSLQKRPLLTQIVASGQIYVLVNRIINN